MEQLGSHWTNIHEIWYLSIFRNSVEIIQVSLKSHKNKGYFTGRPIHIFHHISHFLEWEMFRENAVQKIKINILCSITIFENRDAYDIMWKKYCKTGHATDDNMVHAHWMTDTPRHWLLFILLGNFDPSKWEHWVVSNCRKFNDVASHPRRREPSVTDRFFFLNP